MNFAEIRFWMALGAGLLAVAVIRFAVRLPGIRSQQAESSPERHASRQLDQWLLFGLGLGLLFFVGWLTAAVFLYVALVTYGGTRILLAGRLPAGPGMAMLILLQISPLVFFKYGNFVGNEVLQLGMNSLVVASIPVGISFYTFQCMSFSWDTLRGRRESLRPMPGLLHFLNYAGFFPQIVAGPIERRTSLLPQMENFRFQFSAASVERGTRWVVIGLFFKLCLGDNLSLYSMPGQVTESAWTVWMQNLLFGLRIYFDFAGYSLCALGVGHWFGISLSINFLSPYTSRNITDFWRRWHVTLSQWFRDYVYLPLGGNKWTAGVVPLLIVFLVSGVWHGAGWNFILWGLIHGLMVLAHRTAGAIRLNGTIGWALTMAGVFLAWLFFYQTDTAVLFSNLGTIISPPAYGPDMLRELVSSYASGDKVVLAGLLLMTGVVLLLELAGHRRHGDPYFYFGLFPVQMVMCVLTVLMAPGAQNNFIYFAF